MARWSTAVVILALLFVGTPVVNGSSEGVAIWKDGSDNPPGCALWDGTEFSASQHMREIYDDYWVIIQGAYSPVRDEAIVMGVSFDEEITAQIYSGGQWSYLPFSPQIITSPTVFSRTFDVQYESQSGNPIIVWSLEKIEEMAYAKWTGSKWTSGKIPTPSRGRRFGKEEINLKASPKSNEMVLVVDIMGVSECAIVWDGNSWTNGIDLENVYRDGVTMANVAYEQQSGRAIIIYADGSTSLKYRIWNGVSWSGEGSASPPAGIQNAISHVTIGADPSTNRLVAAAFSFRDDASWVTVWDGNTWGSKVLVGLGWMANSAQNIAVAFEGTSQRALAAYGGDGGIAYRTWSPISGWSDDEEGPRFGADEPNTVVLYTDSGSNDVMMGIKTQESVISFWKWSDAGWGVEVKQITSNRGRTVRFQPFFFMWKPTAAAIVAQTPLPTSLPTLPPTTLPTPSPSTKPTQQPTDKPTPQPTTTPTAPPTPSPTTSPTYHPTLFLTNPSTPAPSTRLTKIPTPFPTSARSEKRNLTAGHPCDNNSECQSSTCRNGVCMATSACYPLRHNFGEQFFEHKVNIVFVASGFDNATKDEWQTHVNRIYQSFENYNMFSSKVEQLNMFRVDPWKLDSSFCAVGCLGIARVLCCEQNQALSLAQNCFPYGSNLQTVVIHNDERYGGGYIQDNMATVTTHPKASVVAAHELGHSLFDLTDEYSYGPGTDVDPNCDSTRSCDKWSDLIGNSPAAYDRVRCLPGCRNGNFYVGAKSFMNNLTYPMGAVNERFTCCTYCALTKSFPSYCDVFDSSPDYLLNYCKSNDYQRYGTAAYDREPLLSISDGTVQDSRAKYVQVGRPVLVLITARTKRSGGIGYKTKMSPLDSGMFLRPLVEGDFSSPRMAWKQGFDSVLKVMTIYHRAGKETLYMSRNTTIEVPLSLDPADDDDDVAHQVSERAGSLRCVLSTNGKRIKKIRVKVIGQSKKAID